MKKVEIDEKEVCHMYTELDMGTESIAKELHVGKARIRDVLNKNGIKRKTVGGQVTHEKYVIEDFKEKKYVNGNGYHFVAVDKNTGVESSDIDNSSGFLTTYIEKAYNIKTPTLYDRRQYYMTTGNYWWEQWLTVEKREDKKTKKCPYCEWRTYDVDNKSGSFRCHLKKKHGIEVQDYVKEHPEDKEYMTFANPTLNMLFETDSFKYVTCGVCGRKFKRITKQHISSHGLTVCEYERRYGKRLSEQYDGFLRDKMIKTNSEMKPSFTSKPQLEIKEFLESKGFECRLNDRKILKGKEIDIYVPSLKIGIEYNGNFWHCEGMNGKTKTAHLDKTEEANGNGIRLIQIFEDEYFLHKDIVFSKISHILHICNDLPKIPARKCLIRSIGMEEADLFLEQFHIQGFSKSTIYIGAFYNNVLVGVMSFLENKKSTNEWTLNRFSTDSNYICQGIGGKMFKYFIRKHNPISVKTFADRRWTVDEKANLYVKLGFEFDGYTEPNYTYYNSKVDKYRRFHKFGFRKQSLHKKYGFPLYMTESEMTEALGYKKIWDCGLIRYVYRSKDSGKPN